MNLSSGETPGISLPPPLAEQASGQAAGAAGPESGQGSPERPEASPRGASAQPAGAQTMNPVAAQAAAQAGQAAESAPPPRGGGAPAGPTLAADNDDIEKEWVGKIKKVVEQTRYDPYQQSEQLTVVKADYMKQRYNKIIKLEK